MVVTLRNVASSTSLNWKMKNFYESCMNLDNIETDEGKPLKRIISSGLGTFSLLAVDSLGWSVFKRAFGFIPYYRRLARIEGFRRTLVGPDSDHRETALQVQRQPVLQDRRGARRPGRRTKHNSGILKVVYNTLATVATVVFAWLLIAKWLLQISPAGLGLPDRRYYYRQEYSKVSLARRCPLTERRGGVWNQHVSYCGCLFRSWRRTSTTWWTFRSCWARPVATLRYSVTTCSITKNALRKLHRPAS